MSKIGKFFWFFDQKIEVLRGRGMKCWWMIGLPKTYRLIPISTPSLTTMAPSKPKNRKKSNFFSNFYFCFFVNGRILKIFSATDRGPHKEESQPKWSISAVRHHRCEQKNQKRPKKFFTFLPKFLVFCPPLGCHTADMDHSSSDTSL